MAYWVFDDVVEGEGEVNLNPTVLSSGCLQNINSSVLGLLRPKFKTFYGSRKPYFNKIFWLKYFAVNLLIFFINVTLYTRWQTYSKTSFWVHSITWRRKNFEGISGPFFQCLRLFGSYFLVLQLFGPFSDLFQVVGLYIMSHRRREDQEWSPLDLLGLSAFDVAVWQAMETVKNKCPL